MHPGVAAEIGDVQQAVRGNGDVATSGGEIVTVPVQDDQRALAPVEEIHPVLGVGCWSL